jgi:hypothetical protein
MRQLANLAVYIAIGLGILVLVEMSNRDSRPPQTAVPSQPPNFVRRLDVKAAQDRLLRMGFDVTVSFIQEDDSKMIIYGKSVNRPFAYNLMAQRDFNKMLHDGKFTEVTFMDSMSFPDFVQTYEVK